MKAFTLFAAVLLAAAGAAAAAPALQPGDTLSIQIARFPEFSRNATIADDGTVRVGGVGPVRAAGLTLDDVSAAITAALKERLGLETTSVLIDIAQHRPVVVYGDGVRGAEVAYRPGMTIVHALAASRTRGSEADGSVLEKLEAERVVTRLVQNQERLALALSLRARLVAERDDGEIVAPDLSGLGLQDVRIAEIVQSEKALRDLRKRQLQDQIDNLARQRAAVERQIASLAQELELQREREYVATEAATRLRALDARGLATQNRLVEVNTELVNARLLVIRILADRAGAETRLAQIDTAESDLKAQRTLELVRMLADVETEIAAARRDVAAGRRESGLAEEHLGGLSAAAAPGASSYRIHRENAGGAQVIEAELFARLEPGDIVEVVRE
ncbi:MAG: polysaccharide biosynthesis/export family protein [Pseudochelatococcus sp.]|jgi:protein involved in polysaccharide export with SLBB domain|uniref:polysaccharide biosynthesis/export family protein n=1 Tax=Pseudochelatococcus sp. TaxID=2020869 RepID=UPI003D910396